MVSIFQYFNILVFSCMVNLLKIFNIKQMILDILLLLLIHKLYIRLKH
jgi:hypothetical protein